MQKEMKNVQAFRFNANDKDVRTILIENEPWFVAKDVCDILDHTNASVAIQMLDDDERAKHCLGRQGETWIVNESGLYNLIFKSRKPEAKSFRKWVTAEVLPAIRKNGYFVAKPKSIRADFIDARDKIYGFVEFNGRKIRHIIIEEKDFYSINDINAAIGSSTRSGQCAAMLNKKKELATKIFIFGNTHPAWFTTGLGMQLLIQGSKIIKANSKILL